MNVWPALSIAAQNLAALHDTTSPQPVWVAQPVSTAVGADQCVPSNRNAFPTLSSATQVVAVGQDTVWGSWAPGTDRGVDQPGDDDRGVAARPGRGVALTAASASPITTMNPIGCPRRARIAAS
jgi:hypothetical protein